MILLFDLDFGAESAPNLGDPNFLWFPADFTSQTQFEMQTSPEPNTFTLVVFGLAGIAGVHRAQRIVALRPRLA